MTAAYHARLVELTAAGWDMHDRIIVVARRREALMLSDLSHDEVATLAALLGRVHRRIPDLLAIEPGDL